MKVFQKIALATFAFTTLLFASCEKKVTPTPDPQPDPSSKIEITMSDLNNKYFIFDWVGERNVNLFYFSTDKSKVYYESRQRHRDIVPVLEDVNTNAGTATLKLDYNSDGNYIIRMYFKKSSAGLITLEKVTYNGSIDKIKEITMNSLQDISGFSFSGAKFEDNDDYHSSYEFTSTKLNYIGFDNGITDWKLIWEKPYYKGTNDLYFKTNDESCFGVVYKRNDGKMGIIIDMEGYKKMGNR